MMRKTDSLRTERGYFTPESMIWRISREQALMIGGGRALLMQVAHPLVVAGVAAHSNYREEVWQRLERTMEAVWAIVYGTRAEADRAAARVRSMHARVRGRITEQMGSFPAGTPYSAGDPKLLMWVHGTLVDSALRVYEDWVRPLNEEEKEAYYEDAKVMARIFGTPASVIPATLDDFRAYMSERLASDEICVTEAARDVCDSVMNPPLPVPLRPPWQAVNLVTAYLLPPQLREQYGLDWDPARGALIGLSRRAIRRALPLMPDLARAIGAARRAEQREARLALAA